MTREHRQAYMEGFGAAMLADDYREQTAELSQEFSQFGVDPYRLNDLRRAEWVRGNPELRDWYKWWKAKQGNEGRSIGAFIRGRGRRSKIDEIIKRRLFKVKVPKRGERKVHRLPQGQYSSLDFGSDFKPIDPACYGPGGAPGCEFGGSVYVWPRGLTVDTVNAMREDVEEEMNKSAKEAYAWATRPSKVKEIAGNDFRAVVANVSDKYGVTQRFVRDYAPPLEVWQGLYVETVKRTLRKKGWSNKDLGEHGFGRMGVPAGMQLPGSWGVPHASMVRPGETPEGWDPNLFRGFGGRFDKAALRKQREDFKTIYRDADIDLRKATDRYHANPTLSALTQVRKFGNRRNKAWKKMMKIQQQLGNKGLPFVAPVEDPWWNQ